MRLHMTWIGWQKKWGYELRVDCPELEPDAWSTWNAPLSLLDQVEKLRSEPSKLVRLYSWYQGEEGTHVSFTYRQRVPVARVSTTCTRLNPAVTEGIKSVQ